MFIMLKSRFGKKALIKERFREGIGVLKREGNLCPSGFKRR